MIDEQAPFACSREETEAAKLRASCSELMLE